MESNKVNINDYILDCYNINTLIIGSGAASLNAALSLDSFGVKDVLIVTDTWGGGTSNNAGSDKQTYYKLSISGTEPDSVHEMASDLFRGQCMHGDIALCEAQGSIQAFMRLVGLGVKFPHDQYGSYPGYKTDHDPRSRATSAGPYTSRRMFEALAAEVKKREVPVLNHHHCIALLTDKGGSEVRGALAINNQEKDYKKAFVLFNSLNVVLGTGGPAGIYETSVYPKGQSGSTGMALLAGATGQNLGESQFGIASVKFRWNLSGSYQQAIPRYISTDENGNDEKEFLNEHFPDLKTLAKAIFLKGYQWPFDPRKISGYRSSLIDLLVERETKINHRKVFLDYRKNLQWKGNDTFSPADLDDDVENYLRNSGALKNSPIERLKAMNSPAVDLYRAHNIDLENEYLEISVCNQHNNGGLKGNIWWESNLRHLFPVGEVNGSHGVYRPGGSALNSGQVGSYRAAMYISRKYKGQPEPQNDFMAEVIGNVEELLTLSGKWMSQQHVNDNKRCFSEIRKRMSESAGIIRNEEKVAEAVEEAYEMTGSLREKLGAQTVQELSDCFLLMDHCLTHYIYLKSISFYIKNGGRSRGSYLISERSLNNIEELVKTKVCGFDREVEKKIIEASCRAGKISMSLEEVREIPVQDLWFETVWKEYQEDN